MYCTAYEERAWSDTGVVDQRQLPAGARAPGGGDGRGRLRPPAPSPAAPGTSPSPPWSGGRRAPWPCAAARAGASYLARLAARRRARSAARRLSPRDHVVRPYSGALTVVVLAGVPVMRLHGSATSCCSPRPVSAGLHRASPCGSRAVSSCCRSVRAPGARSRLPGRPRRRRRRDAGRGRLHRRLRHHACRASIACTTEPTERRSDLAGDEPCRRVEQRLLHRPASTVPPAYLPRLGSRSTITAPAPPVGLEPPARSGLRRSHTGDAARCRCVWRPAARRRWFARRESSSAGSARRSIDQPVDARHDVPRPPTPVRWSFD